MRTTHMMALCLIAASASAAVAQEDPTDGDPMAQEVMEETAEAPMEDDTMEEDKAEDAMSDDAMDADMADDAMADDAMADDAMADDAMANETPSLEEIAGSDPALDVRTNEDGEVDAMIMLSDVLFGFGDASLNPAAIDVLAGVAEKLDGVPSLEITGHTDAIGDAAFNVALGQRRADAVRDWLIENTAFDADAITARGVGEDDPIAPNVTEAGADNPEGRALNRRVEFTLPDAG